MSIILLLAAGGEFVSQRLDTTVTTGTLGGTGTGYIDGGVLGSIANDTYIDAEGNSRVIERIQYNSPNLLFRLINANIDNDDQVFSSIVVNATTFTRSTASYTADTGDGTTGWVWSTGGGGNPWGTNPNNFDLFALQ